MSKKPCCGPGSSCCGPNSGSDCCGNQTTPSFKGILGAWKGRNGTNRKDYIIRPAQPVANTPEKDGHE